MSLSKEFTFHMALRPGVLPASEVKQLLTLLLNSYGWLKPISYRELEGYNPILPGQPFIDEAVQVYETREDVWLEGKGLREGLSLYTRPTYTGSLGCWWSSDKRVRGAKAREAHVEQVATLMRLSGSPLAYTCLGDDARRKDQWGVRGRYETRVEFLTDYSEGLLGIFWRTFLGPPFTRLFGERLATLPAGTARDLGDGLWVIEPYATPAEALTEEGQARERAIIEHLGKECFFDHERQLKPTRRPLLPPLDVEALEREHDRRDYEKAYGKGSPRIDVSLRMRDFREWERRHWKEEHPDLLRRVSRWSFAHRDDPDFLEKTPEQVAEMLRAQPEEPASPPAPTPAPPAATPAEAASAQVRSVLGEDALQALLHLGEVARDVEKAGGELLDPTLKAQVRGVKALASLAKPSGARRPRKKSPRRRR